MHTRRGPCPKTYVDPTHHPSRDCRTEFSQVTSSCLQPPARLTTVLASVSCTASRRQFPVARPPLRGCHLRRAARRQCTRLRPPQADELRRRLEEPAAPRRLP